MGVILEEKIENSVANRYLDPTNDVAFKRIFSQKDKIMDFLNAVLQNIIRAEIVELDFLPTEEVPDVGQGKRSVMDLKVRDASGAIYIVEMQNRYDPEFVNRLQYYGAHSLIRQLDSGQTCGGLIPIIVVAVLNHKIFPANIPCVSYHAMRENSTGETHLHLLSYLCIELGKFNKDVAELHGFQDEWLHFLSKSSEEKEVPDTIHDPIVVKAYCEIERFNWTSDQYDAYIRAWMEQDREKCVMDRKFAEGKAGGKLEGAYENARKMLADGVAIDKVALYTGLDITEVSEMQGKLK
jgi:predicted transposase/invertase (TIGR01784 family)